MFAYNATCRARQLVQADPRWLSTVPQPQLAEVLSKALVTEFFLAEPRDWRRRQVLQISPLEPASYLARISFQFYLPRDLINRARERAFHDIPQSQVTVPQDELEIILPIDYLPKYVLLNFSLEDQSGKPIPLLPSGESNELSLGIVEPAFAEVDTHVRDGADTAAAFFREFKFVISALTSAGQGETQSRLRSLHAFPEIDPSTAQYCCGMIAFYEDVLKEFTGHPNLSPSLTDSIRQDFLQIHLAIGHLTADAKKVLAAGEGYHSPLLNPPLLIGSYLRYPKPVKSDDVAEHVGFFLEECQGFLRAVAELQADQVRFGWIMKLLSRLSRFYVAYTRMRVPIERHFLVKMEHVIPLQPEWWERFSGPWSEHRYPIRVGDSRSTHIEVTCEHPIELEQVPKATRVLFEREEGLLDVLLRRKRWRIHVLFGKSSHSTRYRQHFYTDKTPEEIRAMVKAHGVRLTPEVMFDFKLKIRYTVERAMKWGYRLISFIALLALIVFVRIYAPAELSGEEFRLVSLIPLLSGLLGAIASLRPQENIVAIRTRRHKVFVLMILFAMSVYFLVGLACPECTTASRQFIREIPGLGWLVG